ncbi:MAG: ribonuclease Z [Bacteroidales bacterium]|nr:ribonuclease Z [Bacteroidales bacterium]
MGSSSALPTSKRSTAAHLLNMNERFFLIDCGEGTQIQLRKFKLSPARINHVFISHLHGDHVFGLFGLLSSLGMMGRKAQISIYGPAALEEMLESHLHFFGPLPFRINCIVCRDEERIYEDSKAEVFAIKLMHRIETYGYLFREKPRLLNIDRTKIDQYGLGVEDIQRIKQGNDFLNENGQIIPNTELTLPPFRQRSYVYLSDTMPLQNVPELMKGVDLLFHEATFLEKDAALAKKTFHSTARQAALTARVAEAGKLLIGHFSTRYKGDDLFIQEAQTVFPGTIAVNDGDRFDVELIREVR